MRDVFGKGSLRGVIWTNAIRSIMGTIVETHCDILVTFEGLVEPLCQEYKTIVDF